MREDDFARIIVVGDLHAHHAPLLKLLEKIRIDPQDLVLFVGDYIDRGPDAKAVIDKLIELKLLYENMVFLKGNHEDMMLGTMGFPAVSRSLNTWLYNGGSETLYSYGLEADDIRHLLRLWDDAERSSALMHSIPKSHLDFFMDLKLYVETENFFFCHAGVDPSSSIEEGKHRVADLLWIRNHIHARHDAWEKSVVCGHTPLHDVMITDKLICTDTGLYCYGKLSAVDVLTKEIFQVYL